MSAVRQTYEKCLPTVTEEPLSEEKEIVDDAADKQENEGDASVVEPEVEEEKKSVVQTVRAPQAPAWRFMDYMRNAWSETFLRVYHRRIT